MKNCIPINRRKERMLENSLTISLFHFLSFHTCLVHLNLIFYSYYHSFMIPYLWGSFSNNRKINDRASIERFRRRGEIAGLIILFNVCYEYKEENKWKETWCEWPWKGWQPVKHSQQTIPNDHQSIASVCGLLNNISGYSSFIHLLKYSHVLFSTTITITLIFTNRLRGSFIQVIIPR